MKSAVLFGGKGECDRSHVKKGLGVEGIRKEDGWSSSLLTFTPVKRIVLSALWAQ